MNERDKIIEILRKEVFEDGAGERYCIHDKAREQLADALLANGIGDVAEWKRRAEVAERALRNLAQLCAKGARYYLQSDKAVKERERELYDEWINNAEKELAEEKKQ